jgi:hypothetical protein
MSSAWSAVTNGAFLVAAVWSVSGSPSISCVLMTADISSSCVEGVGSGSGYALFGDER